MEFNWESICHHYHPVERSKNILDKPVSIELGGRKIVLFRATNNKLVATFDRCPHRGTPLSLGAVDADGILRCSYHGWGVSDCGEVKSPNENNKKMCEIPVFDVVEKHGLIWIRSGAAASSKFPIFEHPEFLYIGTFDVLVEAPLHQVFDNFSEDEHFPYVHKTFGWDSSGVDRIKFTFEKTDSSTTNYYVGPQRQFPFMSLYGVKASSFVHNKFVTHFDPVRITYDSWATDGKTDTELDGSLRITIFFLPINPRKTKMITLVYGKPGNFYQRFLIRYAPGILIRFIKKEFIEDANFIERIGFVPYELNNLKLGRFDKSIAYGRKLLSKIYASGN